jgi:multifunctional methyltransferase subunit TRM112
MAHDDGFLKVLYHILMNVRVIQGKLVCPETGREFVVQDGIANFILNEEESENVRM